MANLKGYQAIRAEAKRIGLPTNYQTDLTKHDRNLLSRPTSPREFGWVLREHGTHLLWPPMEMIELDWARVISRDTGAHFYWFDGERLESISPKEWLKLLSHN